ncbi:hypothetical protein PR202_gb21262 [Eleusine coracana subsp. coracana]|uniref:Uncharacterized protein n=1 Tax=Eleusine coracana subsp. coracana TaxID=191504 RepID=A0AAV5FAQ7_ELECO|nr:hypothetical protein PR202_gb21262 [Eleusine coracana subsp. coracana]
MEAQGTYRREGETSDVGGTSSIAKHVGIQNQVLKWLQDFSDRVEERARGAAAEVNGLLDEAAALELDMKTAVVSFDNLTRQRFTEHASRGSNLCIKISDEGNNLNRDNRQRSMRSQVPAQDYERDILPRYKEALHIGLASCKDHFRKKGRSTTSVFRAMSTYGSLPHIIGSEEYNHDNSCGLADDAQHLTDDFSWLRGSQGESLDSDAGDLLGSQTLELQQSSGKEPVLLDSMGEAASVRLTEADNAEETGLLASLQDPRSNVQEIYSALVREGLFDTGDEILPTEAVDPAGTGVSDPAPGSANADVADSAESTISTNETIPGKERTLIEGDDTASPSAQDSGISGSPQDSQC